MTTNIISDQKEDMDVTESKVKKNIHEEHSGTLQKHEHKGNENSKARKCEFCDMVLSSAHTLYKHKKRKHLNHLKNEKTAKSNAAMTIKCTECEDFRCVDKISFKMIINYCLQISFNNI